MLRLPILLLLAWPFVEIAGFVLVGREIGVLATLGLTIAMGILGAALLRQQGFGVLTRIQKVAEAGGNPGRDLADGVMILLAGALLLLPGFVSDIFGLLLFVPSVRDFAWKVLRRHVDLSSVIARRGQTDARSTSRTIDLDADDYSAAPDPESPWRRIDRDSD